MMKYIFWAVCFCFSFSILPHQPSLQERWEQEINYPSQPNKILAGRQVIFIGGVLNELARVLPDYFKDNRDAVEQELGGTSFFWGPDTSKDILENAIKLKSQIEYEYHSNEKPIVLISHSKGASIVFYMTLRWPKLIKNNLVERVILIQAPLKGSPIAENPEDWIGHEYIQKIFNVETQSMTQIGAVNLFNEAFARFEKKINFLGGDILRKKISSKIFYVRSQVSLEQQSYAMRAINQFLKNDSASQIPNDGMVALDSQLDTRLGIDLGVLKSDHIGLAIPIISSISRLDRIAFTKIIFNLIYAP